MKTLSQCFYAVSLQIALFFPMCLFGSWYEQKLEGWYYFQDSQIEKDEIPPFLTPEAAENSLAIESQKLKQLLSLAILSPTSENVEKYIQSQRRWIEQSGQFAKMWGKVLLEHPELSDLLATPTSSYGVLAKKEIDLEQRKGHLKSLSKDCFLLFFFKGADRYSQKAGEVAKLFATINGWKLKAVSLDNTGYSELSEFELDKGIGKYFNVNISPSFFVVNPTINQFYPVGVGMISVSELEENIIHQTQNNPHEQ